MQSVIVFISLTVKDFYFLQIKNWLEIVLNFRSANQLYSYCGFAAKPTKIRLFYSLVTKIRLVD